MNHYVGLDVSLKEIFICIINETGKVIKQSHVKTDPKLIADYLKSLKLKIDKVGIESGSLSHWLVEELRRSSIKAICIDARKMAAILSIQINKTDKNDARGIAEAMRCNMYREVILKSQSSLEIGTLMKSRRTLLEQKVKLTNTIRGFLKTYGIRLGPCGDGAFSQKVKDSFSDKHELAQEGIESLLNCLEKLYEEVKKMNRKIESLASKDEDIKRFMTIPGIGPITAMTYKIEIDNPCRFKKSRSVGAYLGMTPRQYSSGDSKKQGNISKCGSSEVRSLLNESAISMLTRSKKWSKLKAWGLKIYRKHGMKKASMAIGRKLSVIMHRMWVDKTEFFYEETKSKNKKTA